MACNPKITGLETKVKHLETEVKYLETNLRGAIKQLRLCASCRIVNWQPAWDDAIRNLSNLPPQEPCQVDSIIRSSNSSNLPPQGDCLSSVYTKPIELSVTS